MCSCKVTRLIARSKALLWNIDTAKHLCIPGLPPSACGSVAPIVGNPRDHRAERGVGRSMLTTRRTHLVCPRPDGGVIGRPGPAGGVARAAQAVGEVRGACPFAIARAAP